MTLTLALSLMKTFGPWIALALVVAAICALTVDRNHLATLNRGHQDCLASVQAKPGSKPIGTVCEAPIATAVSVATRAQACDAGLADLQKSNQTGAPVVCSPPVLALAQDRDVALGEVENLNDQLSQTATQTSLAVSRAQARGAAFAKEQSNAQSVLAAAPVSGDLSVLDADSLQRLAAQPVP